MEDIYNASLASVQRFQALTKERPHEMDETIKKSLMGIYNTQGYTDYEMAATMVNVMIAAGEAPASALAQTLEELARREEIQAVLLKESDWTEASTDPYCLFDLPSRMHELRLSEACTIEGLRLFAPATLVQRSALVDTEVNGMFVPKGRVVGVCVHSVHHDAKLWKEPELFNPERPDLDYESAPNLVTFSKGTRGCPGKHQAVAICKLSLSKIIHNFQLKVAPHPARPSQESPKVPKMVEWSVNGISLWLQRR